MTPNRGRGTSLAALAGATALLLSACNLNISTGAEARDQWQRHYTLASGGLLEIRNTNGVIQIDSTDGDAVDVTADRVVRAVTDQAAKDALAGFEIKETADPNHIVLDSTNRGGMDLVVNGSRHVDYHIRAPRGANVRLTTTNGNITMAGPRVTGTFRAESTNGRIRATGLENSAQVTTTNGTIALEVTTLGEDGLTCETTNGGITLTVPPALNARLSARVTNGAITTTDLSVAIAEQSRHRLDGTIGTGGPAIKLATTNGAIQIKAAK
jgi:DUF4097 and DUF4098 domain-containing protein YvlB